jgi:hypothetical protein
MVARSVLINAEKERFGDSIGRAQGYLMRRLREALMPQCPDLALSLYPAVYSLYNHKAHEAPEAQRYLRDLAAGLPHDVFVVWTGPRVSSSEMKREDYLAFSRRVIGEMEAIRKQMDAVKYPTRRLAKALQARNALLTVKLPVLDVPRILKAPEIDGKLDDTCWSGAGTFSFRPSDKADPTEGLIAYDDSNLYLAFTVHHSQPLVAPAVHKQRDDAIYALSDAIEIFIQPSGRPHYGHLCFDHTGNHFDEIDKGGAST